MSVIYTIENPVGIDFSIQKLQAYLYREVVERLKVSYKSFGRCSRSLKPTGYVAEVFDGGDYVDPLVDDQYDIVSFFGFGGSRDDIRQASSVHLIVFANLDNIYPDIKHRCDEELRVLYMSLIGKVLYGFHFDGIEIGLDKVLKEYRGSVEVLKLADMHPFHAFRMNFLINYNPKQTPLKLN